MQGAAASAAERAREAVGAPAKAAEARAAGVLAAGVLAAAGFAAQASLRDHTRMVQQSSHVTSSRGACHACRDCISSRCHMLSISGLCLLRNKLIRLREEMSWQACRQVWASYVVKMRERTAAGASWV